MSKKLVSLEALAREAQKTTRKVGMAGDLDVVAERISKGKKVRIQFGDQLLWGVVHGVVNAGFRGIEVHIWVGTGANRKHRMGRLETTKIWN